MSIHPQAFSKIFPASSRFPSLIPAATAKFLISRGANKKLKLSAAAGPNAGKTPLDLVEKENLEIRAARESPARGSVLCNEFLSRKSQLHGPSGPPTTRSDLLRAWLQLATTWPRRRRSARISSAGTMPKSELQYSERSPIIANEVASMNQSMTQSVTPPVSQRLCRLTAGTLVKKNLLQYRHR